MSTATLRLHYRAIHHKISSVNVIKINWKAVYFLAMLLSFLLLVLYIFEINSLTQGAFLIKNYNKQISGLASQNRVLEASFAESDFWGGVEVRAQQLNFQKTTRVTYLQILQNSLAEAK